MLACAFFLLAPALGAQSRSVANPVPCFTGSDVEAIRRQLVDLMARDDSATAFSRSIWRLPRTSPDSIVVVRDVAVCSRIAAHYYEDDPGLLPAHGIGVIRVGAYTVAVGDSHAGEWAISMVYDPRMRAVVGMTR